MKHDIRIWGIQVVFQTHFVLRSEIETDLYLILGNVLKLASSEFGPF